MKKHLQTLKLSALIVLLFGVKGCVYHFANGYYQPPKGIQTLYIESIYDTSRTAVPHQILWEELQRVFAADGRVVLSNKKSADAYLRVHLREVNEGQFETSKTPPVDPPDLGNLEEPPLPSDLQNLKQAGEYAKKARINIAVTAEFLRLRPKMESISVKNYAGTATYSQLLTSVSPLNYGLRAREARNNAFYASAVSIASSIKSDFLRRRSN